MLTGKCKKCGWDFYGWRLSFPRNQTCGHCGSAIEILKDGEKVSNGYSPFTAEEYKVALTEYDKIPSDETKDQVPES